MVGDKTRGRVVHAREGTHSDRMQPTVLDRPRPAVTVGDELTVRSLADLIRRRLDAGPEHDVADLVRGHPEIAKQSWYNYANPGWAIRTMPEPASVRKLATALRVRPEVVAVACLRDLGLWATPPGGGRLAESLPPNVDELSEAQQIAVLTVIRSMLDPGGVYGPAAAGSGLSAEEEAEEAESVASGDPEMSEVLRETESAPATGSGASSESEAGSVGESGVSSESAGASESAAGSGPEASTAPAEAEPGSAPAPSTAPAAERRAAAEPGPEHRPAQNPGSDPRSSSPAPSLMEQLPGG